MYYTMMKLHEIFAPVLGYMCAWILFRLVRACVVEIARKIQEIRGMVGEAEEVHDLLRWEYEEVTGYPSPDQSAELQEEFRVGQEECEKEHEKFEYEKREREDGNLNTLPGTI